MEASVRRRAANRAAVTSSAVRVADTPAMPQPDLVDDDDVAPARLPIPPPPMYKCTSYDGDERFSESYDPNPRCEPLVIYYPYPNQLTPQQALSCRWVEDSCVRLSDRDACSRWIAMRKDAVSAAQRAEIERTVGLEFDAKNARALAQVHRGNDDHRTASSAAARMACPTSGATATACSWPRPRAPRWLCS